MSRFSKLSGKVNRVKVKIMLTLLALVAIASGVMGSSMRADAKIVRDGAHKLYALKLFTGPQAGKNIAGFEIEYESKGKTERVYIDNLQQAYTDSIQIAVMTGSFDKGAGSGLPIDDETKKRIATFDSLGYKYDIWKSSNYSAFGKDKVLSANSTDIIFFNAYSDIDKITAITVLSDATGANAAAWDCYGMEVYTVDDLKGIGMESYVSSEPSIIFEGRQLANIYYKDTTTQNRTFLAIEFSTPAKKSIVPGGNKEAFPDYDVFLRNEGLEVYDGNDTYMVKVDIADVYKGGLESIMSFPGVRGDIQTISYAEPLALTIQYRDVEGSINTVKVPVLTSALAYAIENSTDTNVSLQTKLNDVIPQGSSLAFPVTLPKCKEVLNGQLTYISSQDTLKSELGMTSKDDYVTESIHKLQYNFFAADPNNDNQPDKISIAGVQIYSGKGSVKVTNPEGIQILAEETTAPAFFYAAPSVKGEELSPKNTLDFNFSDYKGGTNYTVHDQRISGNRLFLLAITTGFDDGKNAISDIDMTLKYFDSKGNERSKPVQIKDACNDYYGYWRSESTDYVAYNEGILKGNTLYALVETPEEVDYFSGVEIKNNGSNNWGASEFSVYRVRSLGDICYKKRANYDSSKYDKKKEYTDVDHYRIVNGVDLLTNKLGDTSDRIVHLTGSDQGNEDENSTGTAGYLFVSAKSSSQVDFNSVRVSKINIHDQEFFEHYYKMDYDYAIKDHGFTVSETDYTVKVKVGSEPYARAGSDDCGSANLFYFQLEFEHGASAYVLANQQLKSDGFRSGEYESFGILVNRDYGELVGVNIIPEMSESSGQPYDKLMIDNITVTRSYGNGFGEAYVVDNVGWIGIEASETNTTHTDKQITKRYGVSSKRSTSDILFTIITDKYDTEPGSDKYNQLKGKLYAYVRYIDVDGNSKKSERIDVVRQMYIFDGKKEILNVDASDNGAISTTDLMFRNSSTDRFIWTCEDAAKLEGIDFTIVNTTSDVVKWNVGGVGASILVSGDIDTDRAVNSQDEYIIDGGSTIPLTTSTSQTSYYAQIDPNGEKPLSIKFNDVAGSPLAQASQSTMPYVVPREPASYNDTINVYAYLADNAAEEAHSFNVNCEVVYTDVYGGARKSFNKMKPSNADNIYGSNQRVYELTNLGVKQFGSLGYIELQARGSASCQVPIDYCLVQRVRNNVVVDTYKCEFAAGGPVDISQLGTPQRTMNNKGLASENEYQSVTIEFGDNTDTVDALNPEKYDIAVALNYKPVMGADSDEYQTKYVYLTDMKYTSIKPGDVVTVNFNALGVKEITGITIASTSFLQAEIKNASVGVYRSDGVKTKVEGTDEVASEYKIKNWYSFEINDVIKNQSKKYDKLSSGQSASNTVSPVTFTFKTKSSIEGYSSVGVSSNDHVKMIINYTVNGTPTQYVVDDLTKHIASGSFSEGAEATVVLLPKGINADTIQSVMIKPWCEDARSIYWGVDSIGINFGGGQSSNDERLITKEGGIIFTEDGSDESNTVSFAGVRLRAQVFKNKGDGEYVQGTQIAQVTQSNPGNIQVDYNGKDVFVGVRMDITNSSAGYKVSVEDAGIGNCEVISQNDIGFVLKMSGQMGNDTAKKIKISSAENPDCYIKLDIEVKGATPTPTPESTPAPETSPTPEPSPAPSAEPTQAPENNN